MAETGNLSLEFATSARRREDAPEVAATPRADFVPAVVEGRARLFEADCLDWLSAQPKASIHAVVTDPPYGLVEYTPKEQEKLRRGKGGVWRLPPSFDGCRRAPLPRFTTLTALDLTRMERFFRRLGTELTRVLAPGAHVMVASNPLVVQRVTTALAAAGFEPRGQIIRLVMTMRGGDRPVRKPIEGRVQDNLRRWGTGGLRRPSGDRPFGDVIRSHPTRATERAIAPHPSLKPQAFLRQVVRASLPLGEGIVLDPFAGSGSTLAAAEAVGYESIGVEIDPRYVEVARSAIRPLAELKVQTR